MTMKAVHDRRGKGENPVQEVKPILRAVRENTELRWR